MAGHIFQLAEKGYTDKKIAEVIGVSYTTFRIWKYTKEDFRLQLATAKSVADELVEASLFTRAMGCKVPATKFGTKDGRIVETVDYYEHYPPDTTAGIFWLKNRSPEKWRDRIEATGADGGPIKLIIEDYRKKGE